MLLLLTRFPHLCQIHVMTLLTCGLVMGLGVQAKPQMNGNFWWLHITEPPEVPSTTLSPLVTFHPPSEEEEVYCECVKYYLCIDGVISTSGHGIIDIRIGVSEPVTNVEHCPNPFEVCCGLPAPETTSTTSTPTTPPPPTLPPDTPCVCIPFFNCTEDRLVSDGKGNTTLELWGIGFSHSKCAQALAVCCALPSTTTTTTSPSTTTQGAISKCECVEKHLCGLDGYIITDGAGLLDIRSPTTQPLSSGLCQDPNHVCCLPPRNNEGILSSSTTTISTTSSTTTTTTPRPTTMEPAYSCGTRNSEGLRVSVMYALLVAALIALVGLKTW